MRLNPQTYAITAVTHQRRRVFQRTAIAELLIKTLFHYRTHGCYLLHGFVVMPDHLHVLLTPTEAIEKAVQLIKGGFSFAVRKDYPGDVWQAGYHAHRVTSPDDFHSQLLYIGNNPVRKNYQIYPFVHTASPENIDPPPTRF